MDNNFSKKFFTTEFIALGFGFPVAAGYVLLLLNITVDKMISIGLFASAMAVVVEITLAWPMLILLSRKARQGVTDWQNNAIKDPKEKTAFFLELMKLPTANGIGAFIRITTGSIISVIYMYNIGIPPVLCLFSVILAGYGAYLAGILTFSALTRLVSPYAQELVASGSIDPELIESRKRFGPSVRTKMLMFLLVPILVTNFSLFCSVYSSTIDQFGKSLGNNVDTHMMLLRVVGDILVSVATLVAFITFSLRMNTRPLNDLEKSLAVLVSGEGNFQDRIPADLGDDFAYVSHLMNRSLDNFYDVIIKLRGASSDLNRSIQDLNVSSQEISATSNQQAAGVKEIISTMEDSDQLSKKVASQAIEVAKIAEGTKDVVKTGFGILKQTLEKMENIKDANTTSIQGIRDLGDKISKIWDIVNIINSIADQTKIIAFNAELEAASAGDAGRNFQIVATEIRRLADSTVNSTSEIKARINEIQNSSDHLIISSEEGTAKIIAGWELSSKLRVLFEDIQSTSEISADSATQIASSIHQQVLAFDQILQTLKQISSGIDNFVTSTASTSKLTKVLMDMSTELHRIVAKYEEKKES